MGAYDQYKKLSSLEEIAEQVSQCQKCRLFEQRTKAVSGTGNPKADLMFIGEGPGKNEDEQGKPFVGAAGKFLGEMLESIGMSREDVFITNVVKCRPPGNRDPEEDEASTCTQAWLYNQILLIKPKLIILLGRHAMKYFLPASLRISEAHGQPKRVEGVWQAKQVYLPLYHPAAALYNGGLRETLMKDFQKIPQILKLIDEKKKFDDILESMRKKG